MNNEMTIDDVRVRGVGRSFDDLGPSVFAEAASLPFVAVPTTPEGESACSETTSVYFEEGGRRDVPVFLLERLGAGDRVDGPGEWRALGWRGRELMRSAAMIIDGTQTIVVDPGATAKITSKHVLIELA